MHEAAGVQPILICDNDNVIINGEMPAIAGTLGFMAPEIVTRTAMPSIDTDKFSPEIHEQYFNRVLGVMFSMTLLMNGDVK